MYYLVLNFGFVADRQANKNKLKVTLTEGRTCAHMVKQLERQKTPCRSHSAESAWHPLPRLETAGQSKANYPRVWSGRFQTLHVELCTNCGVSCWKVFLRDLVVFLSDPASRELFVCTGVCPYWKPRSADILLGLPSVEAEIASLQLSRPWRHEENKNKNKECRSKKKRWNRSSR